MTLMSVTPRQHQIILVRPDIEYLGHFFFKLRFKSGMVSLYAAHDLRDPCTFWAWGQQLVLQKLYERRRRKESVFLKAWLFKTALKPLETANRNVTKCDPERGPKPALYSVTTLDEYDRARCFQIGVCFINILIRPCRFLSNSQPTEFDY